MSYYDSLTKNCKCYSGYIVGKNILGQEACVSADSYCKDEYGYNAQWDSLKDQCKCRYGYILYGGKCISDNDFCEEIAGYNTKYNSLTNECECSYGYKWNGYSCEKESYSSVNYDYLNDLLEQQNQCPANATPQTDGYCYCNAGYKVNTNKDGCVKITCAINATLVGDVCVCNDGFLQKNNTCITPTQDCINIYGQNVVGELENDHSICYCKDGFEWNANKTFCNLKQEELTTLTENNIDTNTNNDMEVHEIVSDITVGTYQPEKLDNNLVNRLTGNILLQVEERGEAWYLSPKDNKRYYMKDGSAAYQMMRSFGLGITDVDLNKIPLSDNTDDIKNATNVCTSNSLANKLKGKILLQVQQHGEAYYVYPKNCRIIYMKDGNTAYQIMRYLGLGITNGDLEKIPND